MKNIFLLIAQLSFALCTYAQTNNIELYDLLKIFAPDAASTQIAHSWKTGNDAGSHVNWSNASPTPRGKNLNKSGEANITISGKSTRCFVLGIEEKKSCKWTASLTGPQAGYTLWSIGTVDLDLNDDHSTLIENLFGKKPLTSSLVKKDELGVSNWNYIYEIKIPGKKTFWMRIESMSRGTASGYGSSLDITGSANKAEVVY